MKILHTVQSYSPSVGGSQEVVKQISEHLAQRGHAVTVATSVRADRVSGPLNGVWIEEFDIGGSAVGGIRGQAKRYQEFLRDSQFDLMLNYAAQQWASDLVFPILNALSYRKILVPCGFSGLFQPAYKTYFAALPEALQGYDRLVFHAEKYRDVDFALKHGLNHCTLIPNGASEVEFAQRDVTFRSRHGIPADVPLLLTVGSHTGAKGHGLAMEAFRRARIGPAMLVVIGDKYSSSGCAGRCRWQAAGINLTQFGRKRVLLLDPPRPDVVAAYQAADLFIFGSNVEYSPLVLFEAMASRTPFLTTACGNAGEIVAWGGGGLVAPTFETAYGMVDADPNLFALGIEDLIHNPDQRFQLAEAGHAAWQKRFTWAKIAEQYEQLYLRLIEGVALTNEKT